MNDEVIDAVNQLVQFHSDWDKAMIENDVNKIGSFMADDWVIVATEGGVTSKSSFLEIIKAGNLHHNSMDFEIIKSKIYADTGIIVAQGTSSGRYNGEPFSYHEWSTSVFRKSSRGWLCVLTVLTAATTV
jgi:ketosteroid isomerase-like protein